MCNGLCSFSTFSLFQPHPAKSRCGGARTGCGKLHSDEDLAKQDQRQESRQKAVWSVLFWTFWAIAMRVLYSLFGVLGNPAALDYLAKPAVIVLPVVQVSKAFYEWVSSRIGTSKQASRRGLSVACVLLLYVQPF